MNKSVKEFLGWLKGFLYALIMYICLRVALLVSSSLGITPPIVFDGADGWLLLMLCYVTMPFQKECKCNGND
jgi:hypothetical protein